MFLSYLRFTIMKIAKYFILFIFIMQDKKKNVMVVSLNGTCL
jgi:hypothetical protein